MKKKKKNEKQDFSTVIYDAKYYHRDAIASLTKYNVHLLNFGFGLNASFHILHIACLCVCVRILRVYKCCIKAFSRNNKKCLCFFFGGYYHCHLDRHIYVENKTIRYDMIA